MEDCPYCRSF
jgi:thiol-disulfide isomerase/thioredoxin